MASPPAGLVATTLPLLSVSFVTVPAGCSDGATVIDRERIVRSLFPIVMLTSSRPATTSAGSFAITGGGKGMSVGVGTGGPGSAFLTRSCDELVRVRGPFIPRPSLHRRTVAVPARVAWGETHAPFILDTYARTYICTHQYHQRQRGGIAGPCTT